jgi:hypothetical protein
MIKLFFHNEGKAEDPSIIPGIDPQAVIQTVCGRDAAIELIGIYSQRVLITACGSIPST